VQDLQPVFDLDVLNIQIRICSKIVRIPNTVFYALLVRVVDPEPDPDWIRIQWGVWIRIRNPDPGARKRKK
jgi:hypothetical protein